MEHQESPTIYLSPHFDDATLSCGGTIHQQIQRGQAVLVITICAASPTDPFSPYTQAMHQRWGNPLDVVATRRAEDHAAMQILGAPYLHLNVQDCIYRGYFPPKTSKVLKTSEVSPAWYYTSDAAIFGEIHPRDTTFLPHLMACTTLKISPKPTIVAPLGVGNHVDHQLTHLAAWDLHRQGYPVCFYEDYPYSDPNYPFTENHGVPSGTALDSVNTRLRQVEAVQALTLKPQLHYFAAENLQAKVASMQAYASQIGVLFGDQAAIIHRMEAYSLLVGEGKLAERVWVVG